MNSPKGLRMIEIPSDILDAFFEKSFVTGSVWFFKQFCFPSTGEHRDKFIVELNPQAADGNAYFALPTSHVQKLLNNSILVDDCLVIPQGTTTFFPLETVIQVSNIQSLAASSVRSTYVNCPFPQKMEYKGQLLQAIFDEVRVRIKASKRISPKLKGLVFPE